MTIGFLGTSIYSGFKWIIKKNATQAVSLNYYRSLIAELAETIIPATDTPGAMDARVEDFIIKTILECEDSNTQSRFISGLMDLQSYTMRNYNRTFKDCSLENRINILEHYEKKAFKPSILNKIERKFLGEPFFYKLKSLTVIGFCTSEIGATKALAYDFIPINYHACITLLDGQQSWATR